MTKSIVLCCDGTSNEITTDSTNVVRLYRMLVRNDQQLAYYDAGVGSMADPAALTWFQKQSSKYLDQAVGHTLKANFVLAYRFLVRNYQPGDRIFLFGFSRGAYTARAIAGAIHFLGLLRPELDDLAQLAWTIYSDEDEDLQVTARFRGGNRFRKSFSIHPDPRIHFVGVWDTVSSFGWITNLRTLPHTGNNPSIDHVRHALAIDEHRAMFKANLFRPEDPGQHLSIKQVWFAGTHSDIGGGFAPHEGGLSRITLRWMLREAEQQGLLIDEEQRAHILGQIGTHDADEVGLLHESLTGPLFRLMELLPRRTWRGKDKGTGLVGPNFGKRRFIEVGSTIHESVLKRRDNGNLKYQPPNLPSKYGVEV
jgi:uncharacterized protein (DUF2235 family)